MEYILINEWYSLWYATIVLSLMTMFNALVFTGVVFVVTVVYDIYKQVTTKWKVKNEKGSTNPRSNSRNS